MGNIFDVCSELIFSGNEEKEIPFIGRGNIWIENTYKDSVIELAQYVIYQAIDRTAPGQLSIFGYDSSLSGVFAPFTLLSSGEYKCLNIIEDEQSLKDTLNLMKRQIKSVQNVIQGRKRSLVEFRECINHPVECYNLVVLFIDMGVIDNSLRMDLSMLMRSGPLYGVSFLVISTTLLDTVTSGGHIGVDICSVYPNVSLLKVESVESEERMISVNGVDGVSYKLNPVCAEGIISRCEDISKDTASARLPIVMFEEVNDTTQMWDRSSVDGLTFSIGKYGTDDVTITIGDEINQRHNAVITGAVGQGKSNLISVIIHSLCLRYSPKELRMYLIDFKEGVTFKSLSNIGRDEYLPHAVALGLESDVSFCLSIFEVLFREYQSRMQILKDKNMKSIREYKLLFPDAEMPRILVIIDEFQMMFGDDETEGRGIAEMLEKSVRLYRAAGIHFLLSSQTLCGNTALFYKRDSIFAQVPIRIALKNSDVESQQVLSLNNSAACFLKPREAIVNLEYGVIQQNKKAIIAFADESMLVNLRRQLWKNAKDKYKPPYVFESLKRITIQNSIDRLLEKRKLGGIPTAYIGERVSIDGTPVTCPMYNEPGRNIAILGSPDGDCNQAIGMVQSIALSLALQHSEGDARFLFFDFDKESDLFSEKYYGFYKLVRTTGYDIEPFPPNKLDEVIKSIKEDSKGKTIYAFMLGLDRLAYGNQYERIESLNEVIESGPSDGIHFIGWWVKESSFSKQMSMGLSGDVFNSKIFLRMDERSVQSLTSHTVSWRPRSNRGLISDSVELDKELEFIPYAPVK